MSAPYPHIAVIHHLQQPFLGHAAEPDIREQDARHLPDQAALAAAIFGAFVRVVRTWQG